MRQVIRCCLLVLFSVAGLGISPLAAQQAAITGRITAAEDGRPVPNAEVHALAAGRPAAQAVTNADGRYRLVVPAGSYVLHVESVGFEAFISQPVTVAANGSASVDAALAAAVFQLNPVVVSASKRVEKATEAPAHVDVVGERAIEARPTITPVDHLRNTPGIDVLTSGVQSTNVVVRGFNNIFSGALHALTDNRIAGVPSLRVNFMHFVPTTDDDLERMEVVLGPGSALYGPNTAHGVLHVITKSPLDEQGTTVALSGGNQDLMHGSFRTAQKLGERVGIKVSGQYLSAKEWRYTDPVEVQESRIYTGNQLLQARLAAALGVSPAEVTRRVALIGNRDFDVRRWSGEARADWRATDQLTLILQGGITNVGRGIELTGLGAGQARDWNYSYVQARANRGRLFGQVYLNMSDAGETYLLRNGAPIVDKSRLLVGQLQHGFNPKPWLNLTYGLDYLRTTPVTEGSINGQYENDDETTEVGGYLQSQFALHRKLELVLAGRLDDHSALPDPIFSPRAGLVFKVAENRALRLTYNRAFSTPSSLNQFLDLSSAMPDSNAAKLGYSVRVQGTGTNGFTFQGQNGYSLRSPFVNNGLTVLPLSNATGTQLWAGAVQAVAAASAAAGQPLPAALVSYIVGLQPTAAQIGTVYSHPATGQRGSVTSLNLPDVKPIRESTTSTLELGYRGVIGNRFMIAADGWWERLQDFVTPLTVQTPLLSLDSTQTLAFLVPRLTPALQQAGYTQAQATAVATQFANGMTRVPVGVVTSPQMSATGAQLLTTYYNVEDAIDLYGVDLAATYLLSPTISLGGTLSLVNEDVFTSERGEAITLNAPKTKWGANATFRWPDLGLDTELRARFNDRYPVRSGVYNGTDCIGGKEPGHEACVDSYTLLDLSASYRLPMVRGAALQLYVQNLLDENYRSYPGVPTIGRMILTRIKYTF